MPKLPNIAGSEAVRALQRLGFEATRQRGSHIALRRGAAGCVVLNHREIKVFTLHLVEDMPSFCHSLRICLSTLNQRPSTLCLSFSG